MKTLRIGTIATVVCGGITLGLAQSARADLIVNGGFEATTGSTTGGQLGYNVNATGWSTTGYNFLFTPGTADTTGTVGSDGALYLWGPGNGSANGLPATSPAGGNYVAADGAYEQGPITQTLSGLTVGAQYNVSFYYAGAQQHGYTGANTEQWQVSFGSSTQDTPVLNNASEGFTGWQSESFTFTADATSDVLAFLAIGTPPTGVPPFSLLDGVTANEVPPVPTPEPSSLIGGGLVLLALGGSAIRSFRKQKQA